MAHINMTQYQVYSFTKKQLRHFFDQSSWKIYKYILCKTEQKYFTTLAGLMHLAIFYGNTIFPLPPGGAIGWSQNEISICELARWHNVYSNHRCAHCIVK